MARPARVTINYGAIASLFQNGGEVMTFTRRVTNQIKDAAIIEAPLGASGSIKRSHRVFVTPSTVYGCHGTLRNDSLHGAFVHGGTAGNGAGYIFPTHGPRLGPFPGLSGTLIMPDKVRGQRANPWMRRAARQVMLRYGVAIPPDAD